MEEEKEQSLTAELLIAFVLADVEVFLLQNKEQTDYSNKRNFTREEIVHQLESTASKLTKTLSEMGLRLDKPLEFDQDKLLMYKLAMKADKTFN
tara:strand:+ start:243 stop:524 length:282 start_codon:yes stop_codon:yes gene_type:complete